MEVFAIRLRKEGRKLSLDKLHSTPPVRGFFLYDRTRTRVTNEPCRGAWLTLVNDQSRWLFPALRPAEIMVMRRNDIIVVGTELVGDRRSHKEWPQAWWCRIVQPEDDDPGPFSALPSLQP